MARIKYYNTTTGQWEYADQTNCIPSDWMQNDESAADFIKNRTHWVEAGVILSSTTVTTDLDNSANLPFFSLVLGDEYVVTYNGTDYACTAYDMSDVAGSEAYILGNGTLAGLPSNGEPFTIVCYPTHSVCGIVVDSGQPSTVTVSITDKSGTVHKLDPKFIPDDHINELIDAKVAESGGGLTAEQITALDNLFKIAVYTADATAAYAMFKIAFGIEEPEEPDEPDTPEVTLTSISAVYSGGDVPVGTTVSALTDVVVTAYYSDGTSATVTGYILSGMITEGSNTITVSYGGMTTTFVVTGTTSGETETETLVIVPATSYPNVTTFEYTEGTGWGQYVVAKQGTIQGGLVSVQFDPTMSVGWDLNFYVFDADGNPYCQTDKAYSGNNTYYYWGQNELPGWEDVGAATGFGSVKAPFTVQMPEGCTFIACMRRGSQSTNDDSINSNSSWSSWAGTGGVTITVTG